jgi:hypothetical protein
VANGSSVTVLRHTLDIYGTELYLVTTKRDWATLRRRLTFLEEPPRAAGQATFALWEPKGSGVTESHLVVWIDPSANDEDMDLIETAAHEATHGVQQIFEWIGHDVKGVDEPSAYLIGWLTRWIVAGVR